MQDLNVAIIQSDLVWEDTKANIQKFDKKLDEIPPETDLIILPELFNTGFSIKSDKNAQPQDGEAFQWLKQKAAQKDLCITGSIFIKTDDQLFNRLYWMQPNGEFVTYNKRHLFRFGGEQKIVTSGHKRVIVDLKGWKILPQICYDLRFPVWSKNRFINGSHEYDLLFYVANWPVARNFAWKSLLIARAIENQSFCIGVNRVGIDGYGNQHSGDSMILNPQGQIMAECKPFSEEIIASTLCYNELTDYRKAFPVGMDWDEFDVKNLFNNNA